MMTPQPLPNKPLECLRKYYGVITSLQEDISRALVRALDQSARAQNHDLKATLSHIEGRLMDLANEMNEDLRVLADLSTGQASHGA
jgi:hypothetical protein